MSSEQSIGDSSGEEDSAAQAFSAKELATREAEPVQVEVESQVGRTISRYVVLEEVGLGGMGQVLRAYDPRLQREVAVKLLRANALSEEACARLVNEARAMAKVSHPNAWPGEGVPRFVIDALERGMAPVAEDRWPSMEALLETLVRDPAKRWRTRLAMAGMGTLAVSTAVFGWQVYAVGPSSVCAGAREELEVAWGDARRAEAKSALLAEDTPYARRLWARTESRLDDYTRAWVGGHEEACRATSVLGVQSEAVLDLRMACLQAVELDLRAVTGVLANADTDVRQHVDAVLDGLPPVEDCADIERLQSEVKPPPPADADRVRSTRMLLAEAEAERNAGRYDAALERTREAELTLVGVDYMPVRAELVLEQGKVLDALGRCIKQIF